MNFAHNLFLLMFNLSQLHSRSKIIELFVDGMNDAFSSMKLNYLPEKGSENDMEIKTRNSFFGVVEIENEGELSGENRSLIQNAVQMLAVILERLVFDENRNEEKLSIEKIAEERNVKLQQTVGELKKARKASLNLIEDLTEEIEKRKQSEEELKESKERFSTAFKASPAPLVISDINTGLFIDVNDRWEEMLGYSKEELIGNTSKEVGIWADPVERDRIIQQLIRNGSFKDEYIEFKTNSGEVILALWSAETIMQSGRKVMLSMIHDITERVKAEDELRCLKENLEVEVEEKTSELRERIAELERFQNATIEREFRIKELREEIKLLKDSES